MNASDKAAGSSVPRFLINEDGSSFTPELPRLHEELGALANSDREAYRNANAAAIATHCAPRILVVAGPGAGKSYLFMDRIKHWLEEHPGASIYVTSFVRKLVMDLRSDIDKKAGLDEEQADLVTATTLHRLARSIVERAQGTSEQRYHRNIKIIAHPWTDVVWNDVLELCGDLDGSHPYRSFERQMHTGELDDTPEWREVREMYGRLSQFYNAVGFADLIVLARAAVEESSEMIEHELWIIDEFQDFNAAEEALIAALTARAKGVLIAGDDEQALYQGLKSSLPEIIVSYYEGTDFANAMLPYCNRCSYYVCLAASAFITPRRGNDAIAKVYLPITEDAAASKVQLVATWSPPSAVAYIGKFIEDHREELEAHQKAMEEDMETDPFLLILSPSRDLNFYRTSRADEQLRRLVAEWSATGDTHTPDYGLVAGYYAAGANESDNFAVRRVLDYEGVDRDVVTQLLSEGLERDSTLGELVDRDLADVAERFRTVASIVTSDQSAEAQVAQLEHIVSLDNPGLLAEELDRNPLGRGAGTADENEEEIPTAGAMGAVELMTMVGAKGLSAHHVMIVGCDDVNLRRVSPLAFFVALTRARKSLHLITSLQAGGSSAPHEYVGDLPEEYCEYKTYTKARGVEELHNLAAFEDQIVRWRYAQRSRRRS